MTTLSTALPTTLQAFLENHYRTKFEEKYVWGTLQMMHNDRESHESAGAFRGVASYLCTTIITTTTTSHNRS